MQQFLFATEAEKYVCWYTIYLGFLSENLKHVNLKKKSTIFFRSDCLFSLITYYCECYGTLLALNSKWRITQVTNFRGPPTSPSTHQEPNLLKVILKNISALTCEILERHPLQFKILQKYFHEKSISHQWSQTSMKRYWPKMMTILNHNAKFGTIIVPMDINAVSFSYKIMDFIQLRIFIYKIKLT